MSSFPKGRIFSLLIWASSQNRSWFRRNRQWPKGSFPKLTLPIRTLWSCSTLKPTSSHIFLICRFFPSFSTNLNWSSFCHLTSAFFSGFPYNTIRPFLNASIPFSVNCPFTFTKYSFSMELSAPMSRFATVPSWVKTNIPVDSMSSRPAGANPFLSNMKLFVWVSNLGQKFSGSNNDVAFE